MRLQLEVERATQSAHLVMIVSDPFSAQLAIQLSSAFEMVGPDATAEPPGSLQDRHLPFFLR
jgi:hypothetical protein